MTNDVLSADASVKFPKSHKQIDACRRSFIFLNHLCCCCCVCCFPLAQYFQCVLGVRTTKMAYFVPVRTLHARGVWRINAARCDGDEEQETDRLFCRRKGGREKVSRAGTPQSAGRVVLTWTINAFSTVFTYRDTFPPCSTYVQYDGSTPVLYVHTFQTNEQYETHKSWGHGLPWFPPSGELWLVCAPRPSR